MATQVIVVDDDPIVGSLSLELLKDAGFSAILIQDSLKAQDAIKAEKPALVLLDILMPSIGSRRRISARANCSCAESSIMR